LGEVVESIMRGGDRGVDALLSLASLLWLASRKTPEFEITEQHVCIRGSRFDRSNIVTGRVFRCWYDGGTGRYLQLEFETMPRLSPMWKVTKWFESRGFPDKDDNGIPFASEPRLIVALNETDLADDEITHALLGEDDYGSRP
jgi:hypothetical protein